MKIMKMNVLLILNVKIINRSFPVNQFLALTMIEVYREEFCLGLYVSVRFTCVLCEYPIYTSYI